MMSLLIEQLARLQKDSNKRFQIMGKKISILFSVVICYFSLNCNIKAVEADSYWLKNRWSAHWIAPDHVSLNEYGVFHFRRVFDLSIQPERLIVHVTADNRYRLFVNGKPVCRGPAMGDLQHWKFETVDLAPYLQSGKNVIAVLVWNFGQYKPLSQISLRTGFILQSDSDEYAFLNTGPEWKFIQDHAYKPLSLDSFQLRQFIVVEPGIAVYGSRYPWDWETAEFDDKDWQSVRILDVGKPRGIGTESDWMLVPRQIPFLEEKIQRIHSVRRTEGIDLKVLNFEENKEIHIPPNSNTTILLDQGYLTNGYPELIVSGGGGGEITLIYCEALFDPDLQKGNRNKIDGKKAIGIQDRFYPDGGPNRFFRSLCFRTYRYIEVEIRTLSDPLTIHDLRGVFTAYPFVEKAQFRCNDPSLQKIWETGWRTARLCAGETYFDCPYYERLQYVGDTRIQALISLYISGDDRLMRQAIQAFDHSRIPDGLTQSRYPCSNMQIIPPYSLFWISMIYDYWMHRDDPAFVVQFMHGMDGVLKWYESCLDTTGMLGPMAWWPFVDWTSQWKWDQEKGMGGVPEGGIEGHSSILTLQYAYALEQAIEMFTAFNQPDLANHYRSILRMIKKSTFQQCWDKNRKLLADTPQQNEYSQHANIMAVLVGLIPKINETEVMQRIIADSSLIQCTTYYRFYLNRALKVTNLGDQYIGLLGSWHHMLELGLTTFAEGPEPTRSDCHGWSASPNYEFLATVCGIEPQMPGFRAVVIKPNLGPLKWIKAKMPHPDGEIQLSIKREGEENIECSVTLPSELTGVFIWKGDAVPLIGGKQRVHF